MPINHNFIENIYNYPRYLDNNDSLLDFMIFDLNSTNRRFFDGLRGEYFKTFYFNPLKFRLDSLRNRIIVVHKNQINPHICDLIIE